MSSNTRVARWGRVARVDRTEVDQVEIFRTAELRSLLDVTLRDYPSLHPFVLILARTGLRLGEAFALQWADIDFAQRTIIVRRSRRRGETKIPKNGKARRVDMSRQLCDVLRSWQTLQQAEAAVAGTESSPLVFPESGAVREQDTFRRAWHVILRRADLRYRKPHSLRHTYASLLIQAGEPLTYVQQQLGHHSAAFTLTAYAHFIPRADHRAVDALDDATERNPAATDLDANRHIALTGR